MSGVLHITNGDVVATGLRNAGVEGLVVPWRDMLHDGPVAAGLSLEEQSRSRARFLAGLLDEPYVELLESFRSRDRQLATFRNCDEVWLWFEHDLYDQLQLLQILDWFFSPFGIRMDALADLYRSIRRRRAIPRTGTTRLGTVAQPAGSTGGRDNRRVAGGG